MICTKRKAIIIDVVSVRADSVLRVGPHCRACWWTTYFGKAVRR